MKKIKLDRKNMTNNLDEYMDWIEGSLNVLSDMTNEIENDGVREIKNKKDYIYGFAGGLKFAIDTILGVE